MNMKKIYRKIAKENGVSVAEVKRDMEEAIKAAYTDPRNDNAITKAYQKRIPCRGEVPTPEELIRYAAQEVRNQTEGMSIVR